MQRRKRSGPRSVKSTNDSVKFKKEYGTMTEHNDAGISSSPVLANLSPVDSYQNDDGDNPHEHMFGEESSNINVNELSIDSAMNKIKTYRLFFFIGILPMILSFAFSDLIIDSLNFLELIPMGMECMTTVLDSKGENLWVPCSKHRICTSKVNENIVRKNGEAIYRKSDDDYYALDNWVESMDIECKNSFQIGAIGSVPFFGMAVGSIFGAILSAKFGRRVVYIIGLLITTASLLVVLIDPHYISGLVALFIYGIGVFPRMTIGYIYALELTPEGSTRTLGMLMFTGE